MDGIPGSDSEGLGTMDKQLVFVIGSTRSGTSWLHQMLAEHPSVASLKQELSVFSNYVAPIMRAFEQEDVREKHLNHGLPVVMPRAEFLAGVKLAVAGVYERVLATNPSASHVLDKRPDYGRHIPLIEELVPNARYIHIIRDGRDVAISMRSAGKRVGGFTDDIGIAVREWARSVSMAMRAGSGIGPARYLEVRYEKLMQEPAGELQRIFDFLGLAVDRTRVERIAAEYDSTKKLVSQGDTSLNALRGTSDAIWMSRLTLKERYIIDRMAGALLKQLGYATEDWWVFSASDKRRMWTAMFVQKLRRSVRAVQHIWSNPEYKAD
ncbi:MAG: sulfotransferase [Flavobacteriales bacterium]